MSNTISFINATTYRTSTAGIPGVNKDYRNTNPCCFVCYVLAKLKERPIGMSRPLFATNRSLANAAQIFQSDGTTSVLRFLYETPTDRVINVALKSGLLARNISKFALCGFGLFLLKVIAAVFVFAAVMLYVLSAKRLSVAVNSQVHDAQVAAQNVVDILLFWRFNITSCQKVEFALDKGKIAFATLGKEKFHLAHSSSKWDYLPAVYRPNRNGHLEYLPGKNAVIESDCPKWLECAFDFTIYFVSIGNFRDAAHYHLSSKIELLADIVISQFVEWKLAKSFVFPRLLGDIVAGSVSRLKCLFECVGLFWRGEQLYFCGKFHIPEYIIYFTLLKGGMPHSSPA